MDMYIEHSLPIDIEKFGFTEREKNSKGILANRCGRDFLYYALHYYFPEEFNPTMCGPVEIDRRRLFGVPMPSWLVWTCLPFYKIPKLLSEKGLVLKINGLQINSFLAFVKSMLLPKFLTADEIFGVVETSINSKSVCGVDITIGLGGLIDHVLFVLGYDVENLYVIDTHVVEEIQYEKLTAENDPRFFMKLPKGVVSRMWSRFGRVWVIERI